MVDFLTEPERFARLMDTIVDFECELTAMAARRGFHGIHFADNWGTQSGLMISPKLWRTLFKPRYRRQFDRAHQLGLHVWYHCCGNFAEIVDDFHELGVNVLNISQPNVMDLAPIGRRLRGRQCFLVPISYQTVSIRGTVEEIYAEARRLCDLLAAPAGGLIGYVEEYGCMGMSRQNYRAAPRPSGGSAALLRRSRGGCDNTLLEVRQSSFDFPDPQHAVRSGVVKPLPGEIPTLRWIFPWPRRKARRGRSLRRWATPACRLHGLRLLA